MYKRVRTCSRSHRPDRLAGPTPARGICGKTRKNSMIFLLKTAVSGVKMPSLCSIRRPHREARSVTGRRPLRETLLLPQVKIPLIFIERPPAQGRMPGMGYQTHVPGQPGPIPGGGLAGLCGPPRGHIFLLFHRCRAAAFRGSAAFLLPCRKSSGRYAIH